MQDQPTPPRADPYTPRERGLVLGQRWMSERADVDEHDVERVLAGEIPSGLAEQVVTAELRERLDASESADADEAFWDGFVHGARAHEFEARLAGSSSSTTARCTSSRLRSRALQPCPSRRPDLMGGRTSLTLYEGMIGLSENAFINMKNRSYTITAELEIPEGGVEGVILAHGGHTVGAPQSRGEPRGQGGHVQLGVGGRLRRGRE